ncbi:hypothetical protein DL93DRAFT_2081901 [Clavulina sp. PMI_390]|nr:hypothetical protein DL93DRAFT_2081901 [Clavulina sp. PMI_390]
MGVDPSSHFCRYAGGLYRYVHEGRAPGDSDDVFNEDFADDVDADLRNITNDAPNMRLRFGAFKLDTSGYTTAPSSTSLEDITVEAETPISPIAITPQTDFGLPAEAFVKKIYFRLDSLASHEHFHFVKPVAYLLRSISLKEHERHASQLTRRLILEIANTLNEVLKVRGVEDLDLVTDNGSSMLARLKDLMVKIERDLKDCGNLIKSFHRHNSNGSRIGATFSQRFKDRSEGLQRRQTDIIAALALPRLTGKARFRAVVRTIIAQIADANRHKTWEFLKSRRENRKRYVNLVTKQLEAAEIRTIWNVATSLSASEATELEDASRELLHGDWAYYQSLARAKHRKHWVHADRKCDSCGKMPIYGARYLCSVCDNFDLCSDCERDWANGHPHQITGSHDISHPLLKIVRPIIKVDRYVLASLNRIYRHVADGDGDSSSGSSVEFSDDEDPENALNESTTSSDDQIVTSNGNPTPSPSHRPWSFSEVEELPQNVKPWEESDEVETPVVSMTSSLELVTENSSHGEFHLTSAHARWQVTKLALETVIMADTVSEGHYHCVHCKEDKTGTRFIMTRDHRGKQLCPSCEAQLSKRHEFGPLPSYLALLLKCTIPSPMAPISMQTPRPAKAAELPPEDFETASVTAVGSHFSNVSIDRIASLEKDIHSIEERLSTILSAANR